MSNNNYQPYKITCFRLQNLKSSGTLTYWQADGLAASKYEKNHWRPLKGVAKNKRHYNKIPLCQYMYLII